MLNILNISMKNFLSVGNVTTAITLDKKGLTLVLGENKDTSNGSGISRNGVGKSVIIQAISYALYGSPISNIKKDNLINNINTKNMIVTLEFEKGDVVYRIERGRKPNVLRFFINDQKQDYDTEEDNALGENRHTQEEIERAVGMSYNLFRHLIALNTHTTPFLQMKAAEQREVIEELIAISQISTRAASLKTEITATKDDIKNIQAVIRAKTESNAHISTSIKALEISRDQWDRTHASRLTQLEQDIAAFSEIDFDGELKKYDDYQAWVSAAATIEQEKVNLQKSIQVTQREIALLNSQIKTVTSGGSDPQITRLENEIARKKRDIAATETAMENKAVEFAKVAADIENADDQVCVCCGQNLEGTDHLASVIENMSASLVALEKDLVSLEGKKTAFENEIVNIQAEIKQITEEAATKASEQEANRVMVEQSLIEKITELADLNAGIQILNDRLAGLGDKPQLIFSSKDEIYQTKQTVDNLVKDYETESAKDNPNTYQIETLTATLQEIDYEGLNDAELLLKHQEFLLKLLTNKDSFIRKKIIDQNIHHLNYRMSHYLEKLGLPHQVRFMSDLTVEISQVGRDYDFEQLSRGEMNRVIMATSWAFRDVWEAMNEKVNLMFVDEILDQGTDTSGVEAALAILKTMSREGGKSIFLISHKDDLTARINNVLMVRKENDFTTYEEGLS
jgi:DNA repair exonuclease SbcCD ATPase subunit